MCNFLKFCILVKKRLIWPAAFLISFRLRPIFTWKMYMQQWLQPKQSCMRFNKKRLDFTKGGRLEQKFKYFHSKMSHLGGVLSKLVQLTHNLDGVWRRSPQQLGDFYNFFARNSLLSAILIIFRTFSELFERTKLLKFKNHWKELNFLSSSAPFHTDQVQNILQR